MQNKNITIDRLNYDQYIIKKIEKIRKDINHFLKVSNFLSLIGFIFVLSAVVGLFLVVIKPNKIAFVILVIFYILGFYLMNYEYNGSKLKAEILNLEKEILNFRSIVEEKTEGFPWVSKVLSDYYHLKDLELADYLENKKHPAKKSAEKVREISKKKRELEIKLRRAIYLLEYFLSLAPYLQEWIGETDEELLKAILTKDVYEPLFTLSAYWISGQDPARRYLTNEEWNKLSRNEKLKLALERYWKAKSRFEAGIIYERYIGYLYESKGYVVIYHGVNKGRADLGRDLIVKNDNQTFIIQCKRWMSKRFKIINEKHIFQLFGTAMQYKIENPKEKVSAILYTTAEVSDTAKEIANRLSELLEIKIKEKFPLKKYPLIKCNISRRTGEKIYHLPFDQQYDRTYIENERNECYVETIEEAERLGYRRAFRWRPPEEK